MRPVEAPDPRVSVDFTGELNDFLPRNRRGRRIVVSLRRRASVKDFIEALGVPHVEVDRIRVCGRDVGFGYLLRPGDAIEVFPRFPAAEPGGARNDPGLAGRFVLDVHLGKLARNLRLLGFDALYRIDWDDSELARVSAEENRCLLSRDRQLLKRGVIRSGYCLRSDHPEEQTREVLRRYGLHNAARPWSRCLRCNGLVEPAPKAEVFHLLEPKTKLYYEKFFRCVDCGQVYWEGSHCRKLKGILAELAPEA